jgi:hypothetical protein
VEKRGESMGVFRIATGQAIREIIEEHGSLGRFGLILTPENIDDIADRIVDLFEMTIELRTKTQQMFMHTAEASDSQESSSAPRRRLGRAAEKTPGLRRRTFCSHKKCPRNDSLRKPSQCG